MTEIEEHVFLVEIASETNPVLSFEHEAFEWAPKDRALAMLKWPNNMAALDACHRAIHAAREPLGE